MKKKSYSKRIIPVLFLLGIVPYISICIILSYLLGGVVIWPKFLPIKLSNDVIYNFLPIANLIIIILFSILYVRYIGDLLEFLKEIRKNFTKVIALVYLSVVAILYGISLFFNLLASGFMISYLQRFNPIIANKPFGIGDVYSIILIIGFIIYALSSIIVIVKSIKHYRKKAKYNVNL